MSRSNGTLALIGPDKKPVRTGDGVRVTDSARKYRGSVGNLCGVNLDNDTGRVVLCDPMNASPGEEFADIIIGLELLEPAVPIKLPA